MPRVTFSEELESLADGMITLGWMGDGTAGQMYKLYVDLMTTFAAKGRSGKEDTKSAASAAETNADDTSTDGDKVKNQQWNILTAHTSHEYIIRVIAQKYNVSTSRAAGIIQLKHNEEQLKKDPNFKVDHKLQAHVDNTIRQQISEVYRSYGETDPLEFIEDPIASTGMLGHEDTGSQGVEAASDLVDVDALMIRKRKEEKQAAIRKMQRHRFIEDIDEDSVNVRLDKEARRYLKSSETLRRLYENNNDTAVVNNNGATPSKSSTGTTRIPPYATPYPENNAGYKSQPKTRRPRWKYAAQIIDTQSFAPSHHGGRKASNRLKASRHGRVVEGNTLIEQDGHVRVATRAELERTSWKHVRNESEFMFRGVKGAWMRRQLEGEVGGWGFQEEVNAVVEEEKKEEEEGMGVNGVEPSEDAAEDDGGEADSSEKKE